MSSHDTVDDPRNEVVLVWMNGTLVPRERATVSVLDAGFLLGDGLWGRRRSLLAGMVLVGALTAGAEFTRCFKLFRVRIAKENRVPEVPRVHALPELNVLYLGDPEAPFFRYFGRRQP